MQNYATEPERSLTTRPVTHAEHQGTTPHLTPGLGGRWPPPYPACSRDGVKHRGHHDALRFEDPPGSHQNLMSGHADEVAKFRGFRRAWA